MSARVPILLAVLGVAAGGAFAQTREPAALRLPPGARVRLRTQAAPSQWIKGVLVDADSATVALVPGTAPRLGANELRLPRESVTRLDLSTERKGNWLRGLVIGAAVGLALGFAFDVDAERCEWDENYFCSRGEAVAGGVAGGGVIGLVVGALVKTDRWTPVDLGALGPPSPPPVREGRAPLSVQLTLRF